MMTFYYLTVCCKIWLNLKFCPHFGGQFEKVWFPLVQRQCQMGKFETVGLWTYWILEMNGKLRKKRKLA